MAVPAPHPWRTEGEGLDEVARRALLAFVSAPQVLLDRLQLRYDGPDTAGEWLCGMWASQDAPGHWDYL